MAESITRRSALGTLGVVGVTLAAGALGTPATARAQASPQALGLQETVQDGLKRVFGGRPMKDGSALIKLEIPPIAEHGAVGPVKGERDPPRRPAASVQAVCKAHAK